MARFIRSSLVVALMIGSAGAPAFAQKATDDLSLLPVDSELVAGLDFQALQASQLWKQFVEPRLQKNDIKKNFDEFKATCGMDPMKVLTKISIGMKGIGSDKPDGTIVVHGVTKSKMIACYAALQKKKPSNADVKVDGDVMLIKSKGSQDVAFTFVDDNTALVTVGLQATTAGIKAIAKGTGALKSSAAFVDLYKKTNTNDTLWMIMNGNSKAFDQLQAMNIKPKAVYGSINVTKDLNLDLKVRFGTADEAKNLAAMAQGQLKAAQGMVDKISINADGTDLKVSVLLTDTKMKALAKQFAPMMNKP